MSALSFKLGGFFKQLFTKNRNDASAPDHGSAILAAAPASAPVPPRSQARTSATLARLGSVGTIPGVEIPLPAILAGLPLELQSQVRNPDVTGLNFAVPVTTVLAQLNSGSVKIPFGDLRNSAPGVFADDPASDEVSVSLPLNEILSRLNPRLLMRRPAQKQVVVPEDISSPFAGRGSGLNLGGPLTSGRAAGREGHLGGEGVTNLGVGNSNPPAPGAPAGPQVAAPASRDGGMQRASNASPLTAPLPGGTDMFQRKIAAQNSGHGKAPIFPRKPGAPAANGTEFLQRKPAAPPATPPPPPAAEEIPNTPIAFKPATTFQKRPVAPITPPAPAAPATPADEPLRFKRHPVAFTPPAAPEATMANVPAQAAIPLPATPPRSSDLLSAPPVARSVQPAPAASSPANDSQALLVPLTALAEGWPEAVRAEIVRAKLVNARLAMPGDIVEEALKRGRVAFTWKTIRSWIRPGPVSTTSPHDATELELPLAVLAPLFVARRKADKTSPRVTVSDTIPNLFFGLPKPEPSPTPKLADTNYYTWGETSDQARVDDTEFKRRPAAGLPGGTELLTKCATPNEIVSRAAALDGVAGALIALPDGLMVASRIPPEYNGDTLAAFLPHIFSKVSQCTKELRMGDLNNLNFTVGNVPWKIFRVNAIFFAAFGRVGEGLPTAELVALAGELDRKRS